MEVNRKLENDRKLENYEFFLYRTHHFFSGAKHCENSYLEYESIHFIPKST